MGEEADLTEDTMTHITLGRKVLNSDGGHSQKVHYKGEHIGSIESYMHPTKGLRWAATYHDGEPIGPQGKTPEGAIHHLRDFHASWQRGYRAHANKMKRTQNNN